MLAALDRIEAKIARLQEGQAWLRADLLERLDQLLQQVDALLTAGPGRAASERNRGQIRILMDLFRKLDSRVRQLEEKR